MELDYAVQKMVRAIEKRKKRYSFPWQLATVASAFKILPVFIYDRIATRVRFADRTTASDFPIRLQNSKNDIAVSCPVGQESPQSVR
jgi:hypothetical protein